MENLVITTESALQKTVENAVLTAMRKFNNEKEIRPDRLYSFNHVAKLLHVSWATVRRLANEQVLLTSDSPKRVFESSLKKYLEKNSPRNDDNNS
jgi:hypothetical protein